MTKVNEFKITDPRQWSRMGPRAMFGQFMLEIAKTNNKLIVLSADLGRSSGLDRFKNQFPEKYLSVGISEQNLIGVAAGLAKEGYKVFVTSFAPLPLSLLYLYSKISNRRDIFFLPAVIEIHRSQKSLKDRNALCKLYELSGRLATTKVMRLPW